MFLKEYNNKTIRIRSEDKYVCLTDMAKASGKLYGHWRELKGTESYLVVLSRSIVKPIDLLIQVIDTGLNGTRGTWGHPKVAIRFAQWCSDEFAVQVDTWIEELLNTGSVSLVPPNNNMDELDLIIATATQLKNLKEEQRLLKLEQEKLEQSQVELLVKQETTHAIAMQAQEKSSEAYNIVSTLQTQIDQLQEFILSSPPPLPQSIRNKLVEAMQTLGGILSANNVYEGFECYERPWRELGLAMRNSGYRYDLNARYEREKRAYQQRLEDWIAQGKQRGFKPKKYTRPDILERDTKLTEAYEGARLLARRYLSIVSAS